MIPTDNIRHLGKMASKDECVMETLLSYKKLVQNKRNHIRLLKVRNSITMLKINTSEFKDKTLILYVATLLETNNRIQLNLCMDILEELTKNENTHEILLTTFGVFEALESLIIRYLKTYQFLLN